MSNTSSSDTVSWALQAYIRRAPSPQGLANTTISVIPQKSTSIKSMTLSKVIGYF